MVDEYVQKIAGELADLALADERRTNDERIVDKIGEIVGASSQTLQEAFLTAVRVRRAERRARQMLADRAAEHMSSATPLLTKGDDGATPETTGKSDDSPQKKGTDDADEGVIEEIENLIKPSRPGRR